MRRLIATALAASMMFSAPLIAAGPRQAQPPPNNASLSGTATSSGKPMPNANVQLRDVNSGQLVGTVRTTANGGFTFNGLAGGVYAVEILGPAGQIVGTSAAISVASGAAVTGVSVGAAGAAVGAAGAGAAGAGAAGAGAA